MRRAWLALLLMLGGCVSAPPLLDPGPADSGASTIPVFVVSHGWHSGLILPAPPLQPRLPALQARFGAVPYYEFGWGDANFYPAAQATTGGALRALFFSTGAVVQVVAVPYAPSRYFANSSVQGICLSPAQFQRLQHYINSSFQRGADGQLIAHAAGLYGDSQFYAGSGRFKPFHTCNTWTAYGLRSAGLDLPRFTLTASGLIEWLQRNGHSTMTAVDTLQCPPADD